MSKNSNELIDLLGYSFSNPELLQLALTHRSANDPNNERLEFLGDSIVNFVIAKILYDLYPSANEGELSRLRASLINRDTLTTLAQNLNLGPYIILGPGEIKSGGNHRNSILSCTIEAIIGAIFLDGGFEKVFSRIHAWYEPFIESLKNPESYKDWKTQLQELMQEQKEPLPVYSVEQIKGKSHNQIFIVICSINNDKQTTRGEGTSRRRAEQAAAEKMLGKLNNEST